jgi:hypothetical protein
MERHGIRRYSDRDHGVNDGVPHRMGPTLPWSEVEYGPIYEHYRQLAVCKDYLEILHGRILNLGHEVKLARETFKFVNKGAALLHVRMGLDGGLGDSSAEGDEHHP